MTTAEITSRNVKRYLRAVARRAALAAAFEASKVDLASAESCLTGGQLAQAQRILKASENPYRYVVHAREPVATNGVGAEAHEGQG